VIRRPKGPPAQEGEASFRQVIDEILLGLWLGLIAAQCIVIYLPAISYPVDMAVCYLGMLGVSIAWGFMRAWLGRTDRC